MQCYDILTITSDTDKSALDKSLTQPLLLLCLNLNSLKLCKCVLEPLLKCFFNDEIDLFYKLKESIYNATASSSKEPMTTKFQHIITALVKGKTAFEENQKICSFVVLQLCRTSELRSYTILNSTQDPPLPVTLSVTTNCEDLQLCRSSNCKAAKFWCQTAKICSFVQLQSYKATKF